MRNERIANHRHNKLKHYVECGLLDGEIAMLMNYTELHVRSLRKLYGYESNDELRALGMMDKKGNVMTDAEVLANALKGAVSE